MANFRIEVINGDAKINVKGFKGSYGQFVEDQALKAEKLFKQSFSGFKRHTPNYSRRGSKDSTNSKGDIEITTGVLDISPSNKIYSWVNWGTNPKVLRAHNPRGMQFQLYYFRATRRGSLSGGTWRKFGPWQIRYVINHPGISARRFDEFIWKMMLGNVEASGKRVLARRAGKFWRK